MVARTAKALPKPTYSPDVNKQRDFGAGGISWSYLPAAMPGGDLMPHMSGRMRREMIDAVMEGLGGVERIRAWAESNDDNFKEFFKVWARGEARAQTTDNAPTTDGVEALLARLDAGETARVINPAKGPTPTLINSGIDGCEP